MATEAHCTTCACVQEPEPPMHRKHVFSGNIAWVNVVDGKRYAVYLCDNGKHAGQYCMETKTVPLQESESSSVGIKIDSAKITRENAWT